MKKRKIHPIRIYSLQYGVPMTKIAKKIGVTREYLSTIVNYKKEPSEKINQKIKEILMERV